MILQSGYSAKTGGSSTAATIAEELSGVCGDAAGCGLDIEQVAAGVAAFMAERRPASASGHKRVLVSRALHCLGRDDIARRLLMFGGGLVRRSRSSVTGGDIWILDLRRLAVKKNERLDIILLTCLIGILDSLAWVWQETNGRGVLGLKNLRQLAAAMAGENAGNRRVRLVSEEIKSLCRRKLEGIGRSRRWKKRPLVMEMDH